MGIIRCKLSKKVQRRLLGFFTTEETAQLNVINQRIDEEFTTTKNIRAYSTEFKAEAVKKIADNEGNISATAKQLGIAMQTLSNMHNKASQSKLVGTEQYDPKLMTDLQVSTAAQATT